MTSLFQEQNIESIRVSKGLKVREIHNAVELSFSRLDSQLKAKLQKLSGWKSVIKLEKEQLGSLIEKIEDQILTSSHFEIISQSYGLTHKMSQLHEIPVQSFLITPISADFSRYTCIYITGYNIIKI